jgi:hypothetical protein
MSTTAVEVAGLALLLALLAHTGALFYWGGGVRQMLRDHERRLGKLEGE